MSEEETTTTEAAAETVRDAPERIPDTGGLTVSPEDQPLLDALSAMNDAEGPDPGPELTLEEAIVADRAREAGGEQEQESENTQSSDADSAVARDLEKARTALQREGWDDAALEASSEDFILAQGKRSREAEAEREQQRQRIQELETQEEGGRDEEPGSKTTGSLQTIDPVELTAPLVEELGEDAAAPIRQLAELVKQQQETLNSLQSQRVTDQISSVRQRLGERFPDLLDDGVFDSKVRPEMEMLASTSRYAGKGMSAIEGVMEKAAILADLQASDPESDAANSRARSQATRRRRTGVSAGPGRKAESAIAKTSTERLEVDALKALTAGDMERFHELSAETRKRHDKDTHQF